MMNKNQEKQSTDAQDPNGELISTVTATVLQILKTKRAFQSPVLSSLPPCAIWIAKCAMCI